ncbi:hypothetical protein, partial [Haloterrigena salina]
MERRVLLVKGGLLATMIAASGGLFWSITEKDLSVDIINHTGDTKWVTLTIITSSGERLYSESFDINGKTTIRQPNIADVGECEARLHVEGRE